MRWRHVLVVWTATLLARAGPLGVEPAELDFGPAGQGVHLETEVRLTNPSNRELVVLNVSSDCSCVAGQPGQPRLRPGESTTLTVGMDTRTYRGDVLRRLVIHTNAGDTALLVRATIRQFAEWDVAPSPAFFATSLRNQPATLTLAASFLGAGSRRVVGVLTDQPWLQVELVPPQGAETARLLLRKLPGAPAGPHSATLTIKTDDPAQPTLPVKVHVPVIAAANIVPNPVILPTTSVGEVATREIRVTGWEEESAPLLRFPGGQVEARASRANRDLVFTLRYAPTKPGMTALKLQLALDESQVLLEVPVLIKAEPRP